MMAPRLKRRRPSASVRAVLANESLPFSTSRGRDERPTDGIATRADDEDAYESTISRTPYTVRAARWTWRKVNPTKLSSGEATDYRRLNDDANASSSDEDGENGGNV